MSETTEHHADSAYYRTDGPREALQGAFRLIRVAESRQATVIWSLAACLAIGAAYYALATRKYRSEAKLMVIEQSGDDIPGVSDKSGVDSVSATHRELVRSPAVIQLAIEKLAPQHRIDFIDESPQDWVKTISKQLSTSTIRKTNFIGVSYDSEHPEAAAAVVRAIIEAYLAFVEETHRGTAADVLDVLTVERDKLESDLIAKQAVLREAQELVGRLALPENEQGIDPIVARALRSNDDLMKCQQERIVIQSSLASVRAAIQRGDDVSNYVGTVTEAVGERVMLASMGLGESDSIVIAEQQDRLLELRRDLERVKPFFGSQHPKVVALQRQVEATEQYLSSYRSGVGGKVGGLPTAELGALLVNMLSHSEQQAVEREHQMKAAFLAARAEAARQSSELANLQMLQREVERLEKLHDVLFDKIAAVDIHQVQAPVRATIVQEPLPDSKPSSPNLQLVLTASLLGGIGLGLMIAYVQDLADDRFSSPEEMASQLGCRVLAVIRQLPALAGSGFEKVQMYVAPQAAESEAFRTLRTSIALGAETTERIAISSAEPSDGKTTVSTNLAVSYAQTGKQTLLIDCDLRKPGLTTLLGLKGQMGTADILSADGNVAQVADRCVLTGPCPNLYIIPAGARRPDPAELLLGPQFGELLAWADGRYDQILIDCPPVLAVSDAQIVSRLVDGVVLVVSPEKNHRRLVTRAYDSFKACGGVVFGVVANRVSQQKGRGYGYGYGYGYGVDEDGDDGDQPILSVSRAA
jgi:succinoglycan biosynthesis transport protein ExoP